MRRFLILSAVVLAFSGEKAEARDLFTLPIYGTLDRGGPASGEVTADDSGVGRFWVQAKKGRRCWGQYAISDTRRLLPIDVYCSDRATGTAMVSRDPGLMSGSVRVTLSDGSRGAFTFGKNASPTSSQTHPGILKSVDITLMSEVVGLAVACKWDGQSKAVRIMGKFLYLSGYQDEESMRIAAISVVQAQTRGCRALNWTSTKGAKKMWVSYKKKVGE